MALARRWLAFHITFAIFAARNKTRLFSTLHTSSSSPPSPSSHTTPRVSFIFPSSIASRRSRARAAPPVISYLSRGTFVPLVPDHRHYSSRTSTAAERPRDDVAFSDLRTYEKKKKRFVYSRVVSAEPSKLSRSNSRETTRRARARLPSSRGGLLQLRCYARVYFPPEKTHRFLLFFHTRFSPPLPSPKSFPKRT